MNRFKASGLHFALSVLIVTMVFAAVYFLWYPGAFFEGGGGKDLLLIVALVDVTLGPLITLIIFKPGKKGLKFDLAVIGILQAGALAYGVHAVFESRPVWMIFIKDRFELVRANQIPEGELEKARPAYKSLSFTGPKVAGAKLPTDPDEKFNLMISGFGGLDVQSYPRYYVPYEEVRADVLKVAQPIDKLRKLNSNRAAQLEGALRSAGQPAAELRFVPMRAGKQDLTVLVDARGDVRHVATLKPWEFE
jgi:hypothetical protein